MGQCLKNIYHLEKRKCFHHSSNIESRNYKDPHVAITQKDHIFSQVTQRNSPTSGVSSSSVPVRSDNKGESLYSIIINYMIRFWETQKRHLFNKGLHSIYYMPGTTLNVLQQLTELTKLNSMRKLKQ